MIEILSQRQKIILNQIIQRKEDLFIEDLMSFVDKSERTVQYDLSHIRKFLANYHVEVRNTASRGVYIPINHLVRAEAALADLEMAAESQGDRSVETQVYDQLTLLLGTHHTLTIYELEQTLNLSDRSIHQYLSNYQKEYDDRFEIINHRQEGYSLVGDELSLRWKMLEIIQKYAKQTVEVIDFYHSLPYVIQKNIALNRFLEIDQNYRYQNAKYFVWLDQNMYFCLLVYLLIVDIRKYAVDEQLQALDKQSNLYHYLHGLLKGIHPYIDEREAVYAEKVLKRLNIVVKDDVLNDEIMSALIEEIRSMLQKEDLLFEEEKLLNDLKNHFQTLINTQEARLDEDTFILKEVRERYLEYYKVAEKIGDIFEKYFKKLSVEEKSYLTIYLFKNRKRSKAKKRVIVVCGTGKGISALLVTRIKQVFPQLEIVDTMSYYQIEKNRYPQDIDFIISTLALPETRVPSVHISSILTDQDIRKLHDFLDEHYENINTQRSVVSENLALDKLEQMPDRLAMQYASSLVSKVILRLIEVVTEMQVDYPMDYETILALTIHMSLAIPRWYEDNPRDEKFEKEFLISVKKEHPSLFKVMSDYFDEVEDILMLEIGYSERYAIYQYILKRRKEMDDKHERSLE